MDEHRPDQPNQPHQPHSGREDRQPGSISGQDQPGADPHRPWPPDPSAHVPGPGDPYATNGPGGSGSPRGQSWIGWLLIVLGCASLIGVRALPTEPAEPGADDVGALLLKIQGKYILGVKELMESAGISSATEDLYDQSEPAMNAGSVAQRQRFIVLAAELSGPAEAAAQLENLEHLITEAIDRTQSAEGLARDEARQAVISDEQQQVQDLLQSIYDVGTTRGDSDQPEGDSSDAQWDVVRANVEGLDDDQRQMLKEQLGWFGQLALAPLGPADVDADPGADRQAVVGSARSAAIVIVSVFSGGAALGLLGFALLVVFAVFAFTGRVHSGMSAGGVHHGIYAETFGLWLIVFIGLQVTGEFVGVIDRRLAMPAALAGFFGSLVVLAWPVLRGARWRDVRADVGLFLGRRPIVEPIVGAFGYAMALPMLAVGIMLTLGLVALQSALVGEQPPLTPSGGPAHPVIMQLDGPAIWPKIMLLMLAAVAAPIVEETMFRGVLYRHLRDATGHMGAVGSIVVSATVSGFVFAIIHPQGWVAVPALMALAYAFCLVREWRGSLVPAMVIHAISNFIVMSTVITVLNV